MAEQEYTPTTPAEESPVWEAADRLRHHGFPWLAEMVEEMARERAKRPDREQIARIQFEIDNVHQIHGETCLCGFKSSRSRSRTEHLTALFADAVLSLEPETDQELQDRIEVLEKNLAYEVAQKIKLAEQLQAATTTSLTLEQARWKMHAGIDSRCSEEVAAKAKPVIDLVFSSLALEPEAREDKLEHLAAVTNINLITKAMLEEVGYPSHFHPADAPSWAYSVLEEEHEARTAPEAREEHRPVDIEPSDTVCAKCSRRQSDGTYAETVEWPCALAEAREVTDAERTEEWGVAYPNATWNATTGYPMEERLARELVDESEGVALVSRHVVRTPWLPSEGGEN